MKLLEAIKHPSKKLLGGVAVVLIVIVAAVLLSNRTSAEDTESVAYKEETVVRGDLTVGITESGTATRKNQQISIPLSAEVEEIYVKAGQKVTEGEALVKLNTQSIEDAYSTLEVTCTSAKLKLEEAVQAQKSGLVTAKYDKETDLVTADLADQLYEVSVDEIDYNLSQARRNYSDLKDEVEELSDDRTGLRCRDRNCIWILPGGQSGRPQTHRSTQP